MGNPPINYDILRELQERYKLGMYSSLVHTREAIDTRRMAETVKASAARDYQHDIERGIEAAVKRLVINGMTRLDALYRIERALSTSVAELSGAGLGDIARLRRQMLAAGGMIEKAGQEEESEDDADHGR